ncbi:MAG: PD40 domain-containing protein [Rhodospirillaceae bacterium]|nr:PD40 domain-containing protein [Rhodospirillales bacterium]
MSLLAPWPNAKFSSNGRYIVFDSSDSNLVPGDTNGVRDVFVKDLQTGAITRVSTAADGSQGDAHSESPFISADGRFVAFESHATNLVSGPRNSLTDIFVKDLQTGAIVQVTTAVEGIQPYPYGYSQYPVLSADGRFVVFQSSANNLISGDTYGDDIYLMDLQPGPSTLIGGAGDDTYVVKVTDTIVTEAAGEGIDTVRSVLSYALTANVENLALTESGEINGTGNALANQITGNYAANILDGGDGDDVLLGGGGADTLLGGAGNDTLDGGIGMDVAVFSGNRSLYTLRQDGVSAPLQIASAADGIDTVTGVERFVFADGEYTFAQILSATGRTLNGGTDPNTLVGGFGDDTLISGSGTDRAEGGWGDDVYVVIKPGVTIAEEFNSGTDTVQANFSVALQRNVENLTLTGADAVSGVGNKRNNLLVGNGAANVLSGQRGNDTLLGGGGNDMLIGGDDDDTLVGGAGADTLSGGSGVDVFRYESASEGGDLIVDFETGEDKLAFNSPNFGSLAAGILGADNFVLDGAATLSQATFLFNSATHTLSFDADGNGASVAVDIATFGRRTTVSANDILMMVN